MEKEFKRQLDIFNPEEFENREISIIGCGGVGSFTCLSLAKMGMKKFVIWDFDKVEQHNLPNQFFMGSQVGEKKTNALKHLIEKFAPDSEIEINGKLKNNSLILSDITILCCDNMKTRKIAYEKCKNISRFLIDARMGGEVMVIYTIDLKNKEHRKMYEKSLYSDEESEQIKCTGKAIIYNILGISGLICNQLKEVLNRGRYNFLVSFDYKNLIFLKKKHLEESNGSKKDNC